MDFQTIKDKTTAVLSNPRILTFTLIGTTTLLIGAFLLFGDDKTTEESEPLTEPMRPTANPFAQAPAPVPAPAFPEEYPMGQNGGSRSRSKKTRRSKKRLARKSRRI